MPAKRNARRRGWPRGLYEPRPGYYTWRHPETGSSFVIGTVPLSTAKNEALAANAYVDSIKPGLVARISGQGHTVAQLLDRMPVPANENTARQYRSTDGKIRKALGERMCGSLTVAELAELLDAEGADGKDYSRAQMRSRLVAMCRRGMNIGWMESNPAESTEKTAPEAKRGRLLLASFTAIRAKCPAWVQHAANLALVTGADVSTVAAMCGDPIDDDELRAGVFDDCLLFRRGKTKKWIRVPLDLRLDVADLTLRQLVAGRSGLLVRDPDPHHNAAEDVSPARISKHFTAARKAAGIPDEGAPTFHEIRSLSKRLYLKQGGVDTKALLGHAHEKTGDIYADPRGVEPVEVNIK